MAQKQDSSFVDKLFSTEGNLKTDVNINLNTEVYFYLGITIVVSLLVGGILATIGKDLIK